MFRVMVTTSRGTNFEFSIVKEKSAAERDARLARRENPDCKAEIEIVRGPVEVDRIQALIEATESVLPDSEIKQAHMIQRDYWEYIDNKKEQSWMRLVSLYYKVDLGEVTYEEVEEEIESLKADMTPEEIASAQDEM